MTNAPAQAHGADRASDEVAWHAVLLSSPARAARLPGPSAAMRKAQRQPTVFGVTKRTRRRGCRQIARGGPEDELGARPWPGAETSGSGPAQLAASSSSPVSPRVSDGSTGTPGPIVVAKVIFLRYRPFAAAGFSRTTSSIAAA